MATTTAAKVENPKIPSDPILTRPTTDDSQSPATFASTEQQPPPSSGGGDDESKVKQTTADFKANDVNGAGAVTNVQTKMKRAERFGMAVQLSEQKKRNSRAERFGTSTALHGSDSSKQSEELKRKARAERFGIARSTPAAEEEAKKKARVARFGSVGKTDPAEEDKKKAREIRFSHSGSAGSLTKANVKGNNEVKTAIASKAGGGT